jgi:hypothetical protein
MINSVAKFYCRVSPTSDVMNFCLEVPLYYDIEMETNITVKNMFVIKEVALKKVNFRPCHSSGVSR